jgi:multiple sugar transport system substrate-binding protein
MGMKKLVLTIVSIMLLVVWTVGCSTGSNTESNTDSNTASQSGEKVVVEFVRWSNGPTLDAEEEDKVKRFNDAHPNIEVKMTLLPWDETFKKIELSLATDKPVDIFYWDTPAYGWYSKGLIKNLQPYFNKDLNMSEFDANLFEPLKFDGSNMYVAPENLQTMVLYYNKTLFENAGVGVPNENWTWDNVREAAQKLTVTEGDKTTQFGLSLGVMDTWWGWQSLIYSAGGKIVDKINEPNEILLDTPEATEALQFLQNLIYVDGVAPDAIKRDALGGDFFTGKIAMYVGGDWDLSTVRGITDFEWDIAPLPLWKGKRATPYFVGGYVITENSPHADEAWQFIKWAMTENQKTLAEQSSWIPVHKPSREGTPLPDWAPSGYEAARFNWTELGVIGDVYSMKWREALDKYMFPMQDVIFGQGKPVKPSVEEAQTEINKLFAQ